MRPILLLLAGATLVAASPVVKVSLRTSWPAPPLLLEIIETIGLINNDAYFPALDALTGPARLAIPSPTSDEALYEWAIATAVEAGFVKESSSLDAYLALHAAVPKIEAFYQQKGSLNGLEGSEDCRSWVEWYGDIICDVDTLSHRIGRATIDANNETHHTSVPPYPKTFTFDHAYPSLVGSPRPDFVAVLYGDLESASFRPLHSYLLKVAASERRVAYIFRPVPPHHRNKAEGSYLTGYGIGLDLKKMEYLAVDDRQGGASTAKEERERSDEAVTSDLIIDLINKHPFNGTLDPSMPLTESELLEIGHQAAQLIVSAEDPLEALRTLSQNFPKYATTIARRVVVDDTVNQELADNGLKAQPGMSAAWLNGVNLNDGDMNPFALLRLMHKEQAIVGSLVKFGLTPGQAVTLLTHDTLAKSQTGSSMEEGLVDASDRPEDGKAITWWNDISKDAKYASYADGIYSILQPMYPGQFHRIKLNLWNIVVAVDLSKTSAINFLGGSVHNIISRNFPFRFGVVPLCETQDANKMAKLTWYLTDTYGHEKALEFFKLIQTRPESGSTSISWEHVKQAYIRFVQEIARVLQASGDDVPEAGNFEEVINDEQAFAERVAASNAYTDRLNVKSLGVSSDGHAFVNGKYFELDEDFFRNMQATMGEQLQHLQEKVYSGEFGDTQAVSIDTYWYDLPTSSLRRNKYIVPAEKTNPLRVIASTELLEGTDAFRGFVYPKHKQTPVSVYVLADFDSDDGSALLQAVLTSMDGTAVVRFAFFHVPSQRKDARPFTSTLLSHISSSRSYHSATPDLLLAALGLHHKERTDSQKEQSVLDRDDALRDLLNGSSLEDADPRNYDAYVQTSQIIAGRVGVSPGQQAFVVNGRIVGPVPTGAFQASDIKTLIDLELRKRVGPALSALSEIQDGEDERLPEDTFADIVEAVSSLISAIQIPDPTETGLFNKPFRPRQRNYQLLGREHSGFKIGDPSTASIHFGVIIDPISDTAQKWSSLLQWATNLPGVFVEVYIHPAAYQEVPLKRFYRYNLLSRLQFTETGEESKAVVAFKGLPTAPIYTLAMDAPISWVVRPREALHDLDNIQLSHLDEQDEVKAVFDLDYLVVEGHAREMSTNGAPRGVQLQLTTDEGTIMDDTQVVATLGYLQFKVRPGVFHLEIREGRGREIFTMLSVGNEGWNSPDVGVIGNDITVTSFEGVTLYPRFGRHPGQQDSDVLEDAPTDETQREEDVHQGVFGQVVSRVTSLFKSKKSKPEIAAPSTDIVVSKNQTQQADINIFTVASGLLYERFASIMILSVLRNTNSTVKFWFIENFLSPSFLEFIPRFAEEYGFQYELVTYKWPSWLRAQKEKQRIIWAYKILFLDVLFPMDLKKVIFVDADQIVRADMKELVDVDLHGAPYGYTPMGDDNYDMEGFRFWKTGYWKDFLRGLPYHISALYVVDLVRFRQLAAGDILRQSYQQLSADPNSLANLDQDLPNNLQRDVPIFSLHEDWLWCETWCNKDRLDRAKTIDLCQNPLTKEPKLSRARSIPEWEEYDSEIARFTLSLADRGLIRSASSVDINALAGGTKPKATETPMEGVSDAGETSSAHDEL